VAQRAVRLRQSSVSTPSKAVEFNGVALILRQWRDALGKLRHIASHGGANLAKHSESQITLPTLDASDVGTINLSVTRKFLLSPIKGLPFLSDAFTEGF